ncbi:MAG: trypsin-like peptidase domain-containing protein [Bdellovibrio sp.]|nr:trypsin-like peptidase domain-containing protein [Bdellovibrio sp.]
MESNKKITVDERSMIPILLEIYDKNDCKISVATGCLVNYKERTFLLSNYHVFSGCNPNTQTYLIQNSYPVKVKFNLLNKEMNSWEGEFEVLLEENCCQHYVELKHDSGIYLDISCVPLKVDLSNFAHVHINFENMYEHYNKHYFYPMDDVFIIGFPFGFASAGLLPIYKHGVISCEPEIGFQELPALLIDASTRGGMSGSPVFCLKRPPIKYRATTGMTTLIAGRNEIVFLGIYSSRVDVIGEMRKHLSEEQVKQVESLGSDLGVVWKPDAIKLLLEKAMRLPE